MTWMTDNLHRHFESRAVLFTQQNPDGSLSQAAMMQSALAKERREQKHAARMAEMDCIPTGLHKNWIDPMPDCKNPELRQQGWNACFRSTRGVKEGRTGVASSLFQHVCHLCEDEGRQIAANMRGIGAMPVNLPEWKRKALGGNQVSYGRKSQLSILQQRETLPIFRLKEQLVQVWTLQLSAPLQHSDSRLLSCLRPSTTTRS